MAVTYDREQFRQYLRDSGVIEALSRVLMKLYELKKNRPNAAIRFIHDHLADELPSYAEYDNLRTELNAIKDVIEGLKTGGKLTKSQLCLIENIDTVKLGEYGSMITARQSQIARGNESKTSNVNLSKIRKMSKTHVDYKNTVKKAIDSLLADKKSNSLLKKYLTADIYDKLRNVKTSFGSSLIDCISSGLEIHESMIGVYAADSEAYDTFCDLFDPLIRDYHIGFEKPNIHPDPDWGDATTFTDIDPKKEFITSTRIRCVRTVEGFPLIPLMNEKHFTVLYKQIKEVLTNLNGDVSGTWYGLEDLDPKTKRDMINNRYILEYGDRFLESAGATEFWPVGRAVFINDPKTFFVWVNEEDHLRFISMEVGSNIPIIYSRLINAVDQCSQKLKFARNQHFGFLSLCPSNLGNTIRASVMIKVPKLAKHNKLEELATTLNLEIRGSHGHDISNSEMFEISNKRKLGLTEYESIKELHDGIKEIIKMEQSL